MKTQFLLSIFLCLFAVNAHSYNERFYGSGEYGPTELSSNLITRITQDAYGYIWIATDYGLNKFDGINFTSYLHNENDSTSLSSDNVRALFVDRDSTLWVGSNKGLQYYLPDKNRFRSIVFPEGASPHITHICQFRNGNIWVATSGWGVFAVHKEKAVAVLLEDVTALTGNFSNYIYEDSESDIWIAVNGKGIIKTDLAMQKHIRYSTPDIPHNNIIGMSEDHEGRLFMSTATGVCFYDKTYERFTALEMDGGISILDMFIAHDGTIYLSTNGRGVMYIDKEKKRLLPFTRTGSAYNFEEANIPALIEDRDRNLWLGCFMKGLMMIPNEQTRFSYQRIFSKEHQLESTLTCILTDSEGNLWCGTNREGIIKIDRHGKIAKGIMERTHITALHEDSEHTLWVGSYSDGLGMFDKSNGKCRFMTLHNKGYIKAIAEGPDRHLYLSTFGYGFISYNIQTGSWKKFSMNQTDSVKGNLDNDWINTIICDRQGLVWLGHYKGISCYDPVRKQFIKGTYNDILASQICISLMEGKEGDIWAGTYNGLFRIGKNRQDIRRYTVDNGLSSNVICALAQDEEGNIWCSTFNGINRIKTNEDRTVSYFMSNGLVEKIYNRGVYSQEKNGTIYFGGNNGVTFFYPPEIQMPSYNHKVVVTNLYVNNQAVSINTLSGNRPIIQTDLFNAQEFKFSYKENTFTFEFSTMDFKSPEDIYYEYRIKEFGNNWTSTLPGVNQITYSHLNIGKYTLLVRACKYGIYSPEKQLILTVYPPWYKTTWAYISYFMVLFFIGLLIADLIQKKRNEKINELKLQFFINISHEIRSPLTLIINPMEKLLKGDFDPKTMKTLQIMYRNSIRILGLVNQLLDIRKIDKGQIKMSYSRTDMGIFVKELMDIFEYQAIKRNIKFNLQNETSNLSAWIDRNNFDKILINLLSNAFKYTPDGGEITILLKNGTDHNVRGPLQNYFEINVIDSGIGLKESEKKKIFERFYQGHSQETFTTIGSGIGLNLTQKLVLLHQGTIFANNRTDAKGSYFTVRIPMGKDHLKKEELIERKIEKSPNRELFFPAKENKEKSCKRKTNYKVLVIDDEEEIREYLREELKDIYKVITAANGIEGFKIAITESPDLIISDVIMPEMDGFKLIAKLKNNTNVGHIPIILLTSKTEHEARINALEKGADAYLTKPFITKELLVTINNLIIGRKMLKSKYSGAQDQAGKMKTIDFKSSDELLMERIMDYINENIENPEFNVGILASKVGLSRVQLHRKLKELTGVSSGNFIRNIKMEQASVLLKNKKMNISQVAYAVGFSNQTHFSTTFKKFYGMSPSEYISQSSNIANKESGNYNDM